MTSPEYAVLDDSGRVMDAHYTVERSDAGVRILFKAGGGSDNREFLRGLEQLLKGLGRLRILITRVAIDTRETRHLSPEQRTLAFSYPVDLSRVQDFRELRVRMTSESARQHLSFTASPTSRLAIHLGASDGDLDLEAAVTSLGLEDSLAPTADEATLRRRADEYSRRARSRNVPAGVQHPRPVAGNTTQYERDPQVRGWVERESDGNC